MPFVFNAPYTISHSVAMSTPRAGDRTGAHPAKQTGPRKENGAPGIQVWQAAAQKRTAGRPVPHPHRPARLFVRAARMVSGRPVAVKPRAAPAPDFAPAAQDSPALEAEGAGRHAA